MSLLGKNLCKSFFAFLSDITLRLFFSIHDVHKITVLKVLRHLLSYFLLLADDICRTAELMFLRQPQEVQQQKIFFSWMKTCSSSDHLTIQAAYLRRPKNHNTIDRWTVPAFREKHRIAYHIVLTIFKVSQNLVSVL